MTASFRPNVIWIFGDQHRAQATGYNGDPNAFTPNLDVMARQGIHFHNAVSGCPWCTPFRGALLTGQYNHRSTWRTPQVLNPELPVVTDTFNAAGYSTAYFGKWHLAGVNGRVFVEPELRGRFQTWIGYENANAQYECWVHGHDTDGRNDTEPLAEHLKGYETDVLTDKLIDYVKRDHERPFFSVLSVQPPHDPYVAPPEFQRRYTPGQIQLRKNVPDIPRIADRSRVDLAGYYAMIENLDWNVGRIRQALAETGRDRETYIFFFSDHGDMHGSHGYTHKSSPWEESIRIPFLVLPPKGSGIRPGVSDAPMNHVDIAPTTLRLCGLDGPDAMQGTSFAHHIDKRIAAPESEPTSAFLQHIHRKRFQCLNRTWRGVRTTDGWKYVVLEHQPFGLFNLNEDPYELNNLAFLDTHNAERERLQGELAQWLERTGDEFALPEP